MHPNQQKALKKYMDKKIYESVIKQIKGESNESTKDSSKCKSRKNNKSS